jgi:Glycosyl transferase family 2
MAQVSYVIGTYNNPEGLYLTFYAALEQLQKSNLEWEIIIVADGGSPVKWENEDSRVRCMRLTGNNRTGSPQGTRDVGIRMAQYPNVLCVDSHVIVSDIEKWVTEHERLGAAISFPAMIGTSLELFKIYGNRMDFDSCFWNVMTYSQPKSREPFRVCQCAHSGLMIDRQWYVESDGYTMEQRGYGGEEPLLALAAWMLGRECWMIPSVFHAHYQPIGRNDGAGQSDNFARNFMIAAYIIGGQEPLKTVQNYFSWAKPLVINAEIQKRRDQICAGPFHGDLKLLRQYFRREGVVGGGD